MWSDGGVQHLFSVDAEAHDPRAPFDPVGVPHGGVMGELDRILVYQAPPQAAQSAHHRGDQGKWQYGHRQEQQWRADGMRAKGGPQRPARGQVVAQAEIVGRRGEEEPGGIWQRRQPGRPASTGQRHAERIVPQPKPPCARDRVAGGARLEFQAKTRVPGEILPAQLLVIVQLRQPVAAPISRRDREFATRRARFR